MLSTLNISAENTDLNLCWFEWLCVYACDALACYKMVQHAINFCDQIIRKTIKFSNSDKKMVCSDAFIFNQKRLMANKKITPHCNKMFKSIYMYTRKFLHNEQLLIRPSVSKSLKGRLLFERLDGVSQNTKGSISKSNLVKLYCLTKIKLLNTKLMNYKLFVN